MKKYDEAMMKTAKIWAKESYADRLKVGAVLSKDGRIISIGYNGTIAGHSNDCEEKCSICHGNGKIQVSNLEFEDCDRCQGKGKITSEFVLHAEQNALMYAAKEGIKTKNTTMYITHAPCKTCSKLMAQAGIKKVIYEKAYRDLEGVDFLKNVGIKIKQINV